MPRLPILTVSIPLLLASGLLVACRAGAGDDATSEALQTTRADAGADGNADAGPPGSCDLHWEPQTVRVAHYTARDAVIADFDGDGRDDVALVGNERILLHRGTAAGLAKNPVTDQGFGGDPASRWRYTREAVSGDFDGDGRRDILAHQATDETFAVSTRLVLFRATATGGFERKALDHRFDAADKLHGKLLATGDLDGDGRTDVVTRSDAGIRVLYGSATGAFEEGPALLPASPARFAADLSVLDVDGDGALDVFMWRNEAGRPFVRDVWRNDGSRRFVPGSLAVEAEPTRPFIEVVLADVDGDGRLDLTASDESTTAHRYLGRAGAPADAPRPTFGPVESFRLHRFGLHAADFDGDRAADLVTRGIFDTGFSIACGVGAQPFALDWNEIDKSVSGELRGIGDFDGDGRADILAERPRASGSGDTDVVVWLTRPGRVPGPEPTVDAGAEAGAEAGGEAGAEARPDAGATEIVPPSAPRPPANRAGPREEIGEESAATASSPEATELPRTSPPPRITVDGCSASPVGASRGPGVLAAVALGLAFSRSRRRPRDRRSGR